MKIIAQHIVFNGAEFFERVMMNDYLEHGNLQIGWHRDYGTPIFWVDKLEKAVAEVKPELIEFNEQPVAGNLVNGPVADGPEE